MDAVSVTTVMITGPGTVTPATMPLTVTKGRGVTTGHDGSVPTDCADVGSGLSENELLIFKLVYITAYLLSLLYR